MRKLVSVTAAIIVMALLGLIAGGAGAQSPTPAPPTATPLVVTATPMPQVIVVTATPTATPGPPSSWLVKAWEPILVIVGGLLGLLSSVFMPAFRRMGQGLARVLSNLGAGRGFRRWYLDYLVDEYRVVNIRGLRTRAPVAIELEQVYVSLRAEVPGAQLESAAARRSFTIGQVMGRHQRLAIVGGPGCGKTTLLAYLTLTYARGQAEERLGLKEKRLPILVPLRLLKTVLAPPDDKGPVTLLQYLDARYEELGRKPPPGFFDGRLRAGECLVLLDGLDEVADEQERQQMAEWVDRLVSTYPRNRYIVTSRPAGYDSAPLENDFSRYEVRDFEMAEVEQFVRNWYLAVETATQGDAPKARRDAAQRAAELSAAIRASAGICRLVVNPLLLSIVALVHRYRAHLPDRRVELYDECVEVLLEHWEAAKGLVGKLLPAQKRAVLQWLALAMHKAEVRQLPHAKVEQLIAAYLPQVGGGQAKAADVKLFLNEVRERSGLLVEQELNTYAFSNRAFQEYLAACEIAGSEDEAERVFLVDKATSEWWREVLLLYAGMRERDPSPLVQALLERDRAGQQAGETDRAYLLLAGECLVEAVKIQLGVRHQVERELESLFTAQLEPRGFLRAGRVLAQLKGDDALDYFLRLMDTGEERIYTAAALALGQMGHEADAVLLGRIVRELLNRVDERQWAIAASMALSEIGLAPLMDTLPKEVRDEVLQKGILNLLRDRDPKLRAIAARTLVRGYGSWPQEIRALLDELWQDESFDVRKGLYDSIDQYASELPEHIVRRSATLIPGRITAHMLDGGVLFGQDTPIRIRVENQSSQPQYNVTFELVETAECEFPSGRVQVIPQINADGWAALEFLANARKVSPSISVSYKVNGILGVNPLCLMSVQGNPYSYGGVTRESLIFYGRAKEVNDILGSVLQPEGKMDIFLFGERRAGKTCMLWHLEKLIQPPYVPVYLTLQEYPFESEYTSRNVSIWLLQRIRDALVEHTGLSLEVHSDRGLVLKDAIRDLFKQVSGKGYDFRLVLLIDEADKMVELAQREATPAGPNYALVENIRATLQALLNVRAVFAGTSKFDSDIAQITSPLFAQLKKVPLKPLSVDATRSLIEEPASKFRRQYQPVAVNRIVNLSGGHPYYCQAVCHYAYKEAAQERRNTITVEDVVAAKKAVLDDLEGSFRDAFWDRMTPQEQDFLCAIATRAKTLPDIPHDSKKKLTGWYLIRPITKDEAQFEFCAELFAAWIERLCQRRE